MQLCLLFVALITSLKLFLWLPVEGRAKFKNATLTFKDLWERPTCVPYSADLITWYTEFLGHSIQLTSIYWLCLISDLKLDADLSLRQLFGILCRSIAYLTNGVESWNPHLSTIGPCYCLWTDWMIVDLGPYLTCGSVEWLVVVCFHFCERHWWLICSESDVECWRDYLPTYLIQFTVTQ